MTNAGEFVARFGSLDIDLGDDPNQPQRNGASLRL